MGSKNRIAKEILPIILKDRKEGQCYVEPFVGGCNIIDKVKGHRIGSDINEYVIALFKGIQDGFVPPDKVTELEYSIARRDMKVDALTAFIGFGCSYSGKWFGGYARGRTSSGANRNYCLESKKNILAQKKGLEGVELHACSYLDIELYIPDNSLIYCDPPYAGTTGYKDKFNSLYFHNWCRRMRLKGHTVFVSEYNMPEDFICVWSKEVTSSLTADTGSKKAVERLFTLC